MTIELITDVKKLNSAIATFKSNEAKRDKRIHQLACSALNHMNEHGDHRPASKLYHAMGKASNPNEFRYWVGQMCPNVKWDKDGECFEHKDNKTSQNACDMERAIATPFWELGKVKENRDFDPVHDVKGVVSTLKRHIKEAEKAGEEELAQAYGKMLEQAESVSERVKLVKEQAQTTVEDKRKGEAVE